MDIVSSRLFGMDGTLVYFFADISNARELVRATATKMYCISGHHCQRAWIDSLSSLVKNCAGLRKQWRKEAETIGPLRPMSSATVGGASNAEW